MVAGSGIEPLTSGL